MSRQPDVTRFGQDRELVILHVWFTNSTMVGPGEQLTALIITIRHRFAA